MPLFSPNFGLSPLGRMRRLLILSSLIASSQSSVWYELEQLFKRNGFYRFDIKHNCKTVKNLVKTRFLDFFESLDEKESDMWCGDYEQLEKMVFEWAGLKQED